MFDNIKQGEVNFLQVAHDNNCPTIRTWNMDDCICHRVEMSVHQDQSKYERDFSNAVSMNRKARREAERAMRKASKTKAARATGAASKGTPTVDANCSTRQKKGGAA